MDKSYTVSNYLIDRLAELGVKHIFSVPGDYTSDLLGAIDDTGVIQRIGNCNELNAGYAADGYARANGIGAVAVTTGVGSLSVLNAVGGAYVEGIPVIVIIGTLSNTKLLTEQGTGELFHHNLRLGVSQNRDIYKDATTAYERISDANTAPAQIDAALTACISKKQPVAIEIMEDCYFMPCANPIGELRPVPAYTDLTTLQQLAEQDPKKYFYAKQIVGAVTNAATVAASAISSAAYPIFWIGTEVEKYDLQDKVKELLAYTQILWCSSLLGKAVLSEDTPNFIGVYDGCFTSSDTQSYITQSDCVIGLGVWSTDLNEFSRAAVKLPTVWAAREIVKTAGADYAQVTLENFIDQLLVQLKESSLGYTPATAIIKPVVPPADPVGSSAITYDSFFSVLNGFVGKDHFVVADVGLSTFGGSSFLKITRAGGFLCQAIWASIGWSVPAGLGASFTPGVRPIVIVGDGAFKLTCQEISTMVQEKRNTVIFVLNNGVYAVEQMLLDADAFEEGSSMPFEQANVLQAWDYGSLLSGFSNHSNQAESAVVNTVEDFNKVLVDINNAPKTMWLVSINLAMRDYPQSWSSFVYPKK